MRSRWLSTTLTTSRMSRSRRGDNGRKPGSPCRPYLVQTGCLLTAGSCLLETAIRLIWPRSSLGTIMANHIMSGQLRASSPILRHGQPALITRVRARNALSRCNFDKFAILDWLDLISYYIKAFKDGEYPAITRDRVFLWARLYPMSAQAPDSVERPLHSEWVSPYLFCR